MSKESPCKDCICVPICKNKTYDQLVTDCKLIFNILYKVEVSPGNRRRLFKRHIDRIRECLTPTLWEATVQPNNGCMIITHTKELGKNKPVMRDYIYDDVNDD